MKILVAAAAMLLLGAAAHAEQRAELPEQMVGSWCRETDNDDRDFFTKFGDTLLFEHGDDAPAGEVLKVCPMWMLWVSETGFSQSGELCYEFEKIEETAPGVYLVYANCKGQSGVEGF